MGTGSGVDRLSDDELFAALDRGDDAALQVLVQRHLDPLLGYLYRLLGGDRPSAEDIAQEAFLRLFRQRHQPIVRSFKAWLYAIATNLARDELRAKARCPDVTPDEDALRALPDPAPGPEDLALAREPDVLLLAALGRLGLEYRTTLLLRFYNDLSLGEIAAALRIPVGTVKSRLATGLRQLRHALEAVREEVEVGGRAR
jgi:RNA polymerase sigma-70 factor (ECF subfamily)